MSQGNSKCPVLHHDIKSRSNQDWRPNQQILEVLHQHSHRSDPMGKDFNDPEEFKPLDLEALQRDITEVLATSQECWPTDYAHYGPWFIRMAWHTAGTYPITDGLGSTARSAQRFAPLNSCPGNANLDKTCRLPWPIKQGHGRRSPWADLMTLAHNCALLSEHRTNHRPTMTTAGCGLGRGPAL